MQGVLGGIGVIDLPEWPDGRLMEDGRLVPAAFILALVLNGAEQRELIVVRKGGIFPLLLMAPYLAVKRS